MNGRNGNYLLSFQPSNRDFHAMIICGLVRNSIKDSSNSSIANSQCILEVSSGYCRTYNMFHFAEGIVGIDHGSTPVFVSKHVPLVQSRSIVLIVILPFPTAMFS